MRPNAVWGRIALLAAALLAGGCDVGPTEAGREAALVGAWGSTSAEYTRETPAGPQTVVIVERWWFESDGRFYYGRHLSTPVGQSLGYLAVREGRWSTYGSRLNLRVEAESWSAEPDPDLQPAPVERRTERYGFAFDDGALRLSAECGPLALCADPLPLQRLPVWTPD
ncbi:MAG TPA: hypothetical protein VHG91_10845 [Longimicrobium sp.]|nr:hypothetical protein [Longimicrobium sp.]